MYFRGFVNKLRIVNKKDPKEKICAYYIANDNLSEKAEDLYVILFEGKKSCEMMICNFDVRRVCPYGGDTLVMPFKEFMKNIRRGYGPQRAAAIEWRKKEIKNNYASGKVV